MQNHNWTIAQAQEQLTTEFPPRPEPHPLIQVPTPVGPATVDGKPGEYIPQAITAVVAILAIYAGVKVINKLIR